MLRQIIDDVVGSRSLIPFDRYTAHPKALAVMLLSRSVYAYGHGALYEHVTIHISGRMTALAEALKRSGESGSTRSFELWGSLGEQHRWAEMADAAGLAGRKSSIARVVHALAPRLRALRIHLDAGARPTLVELWGEEPPSLPVLRVGALDLVLSMGGDRGRLHAPTVMLGFTKACGPSVKHLSVIVRGTAMLDESARNQPILAAHVPSGLRSLHVASVADWRMETYIQASAATLQHLHIESVRDHVVLSEVKRSARLRCPLPALVSLTLKTAGVPHCNWAALPSLRRLDLAGPGYDLPPMVNLPQQIESLRLASIDSLKNITAALDQDDWLPQLRQLELQSSFTMPTRQLSDLAVLTNIGRRRGVRLVGLTIVGATWFDTQAETDADAGRR